MTKIDKIFEFESYEDYQMYLLLLIEFIHKNLNRYKRYSRQYNAFLDKKLLPYGLTLDDFSIDNADETMKLKIFENLYYTEKFLTVDYEYYKDLQTGISIRLFNSFADRTKEAISYMKFRDSVKKWNKTNDKPVPLYDLNQEQRSALNQCYHARNFEAHLPDTKFMAQREFRKKQIESMGLKTEIPITNKIIVNYYEYMDVTWFLIFHNTINRNYKTFQDLFQIVKKNYSLLCGDSVQVTTNYEERAPLNFMDIHDNSVLKHRGK